MRAKLLVVCTAAFLVSSSSFASKARLGALQFASFWRDPQNIFLYTQYANELGQYATLELGPSGTFSTSPRAEGGFAKKLGNAYAGIYLGHQRPRVGSTFSGASVSETKNPFYLYYATGNMGFGLNFAYSDTKSSSQKEMELGGSFGIKAGAVDIGTNLTIYAKGQSATTSAKVLPDLQIAANTVMGDWHLYGDANVLRTDVGGAASTNYGLSVGAQDHGVKIGTTGVFFYGTQVGYSKLGTTKGIYLPIYAGFESDLWTWAAVRGAISQSLIKYSDVAGTKDINAHDTQVSLGGTLRAGGFSLDGLLAVATSGAINGTAFLTQSAINYKF